jgi:hypothetical protein
MVEPRKTSRADEREMGRFRRYEKVSTDLLRPPTTQVQAALGTVVSRSLR